MTFKFKTPEESPGFLLWQITNHWQRLQRAALFRLDITHPQFVVMAALLWLNKKDDEISQQKISDLTGIDKMSMSDLIKTLTHKKLIKKIKSKSDGRAFSLILTEIGKKTTEKAIPIVENTDAIFFKEKTQQLIQFNKLMKKI